MDSLTHIALGAVIGEVCAGKRIGKKALLLGAAFQSIPDIDFIASFFLSPTENLLAHRGFTHSLLFGILITVALSYFLTQRQANQLPFKSWIFFIGVEVFVHLLLDASNAYGVGWFEPFYDRRVSFNIIFVADPLFSFWIGVAAIILLIASIQNRYRILLSWMSLTLSLFYFCLCLVNKFSIDKKFEQTLKTQNIQYIRYFTTPTAFNNLLWYCVAETNLGYYIGYRSVFDISDQLNLSYFPRQRWMLDPIEDKKEMGNLLRFSNGYFTVEKDSNSVIFNDLRFGRVAGWENSKTEFAFHYYLQQPGKNMLVVQRGRFAEWNLKTMRSLFRRIRREESPALPECKN